MHLTSMLYPTKPTARGKEQSVIMCGLYQPHWRAVGLNSPGRQPPFSSKDHLPVHFNRGNGPEVYVFCKLQLGNLVHIEIKNNLNKNINTPEKNRFPHSKSPGFYPEQG